MPVVIALSMMILSEGVGQWFLKVLHLEKNGFGAPIGVALIFSALEILYLPRLCLGGSFDWIKGCTFLVLIISVAFTVSSFKQIQKTLIRGRIIYVLLGVFMMLSLFYLCKTNLAVDTDSELLLMANNMNSPSIMLETSRLQGYEMMGSFTIWLFDGNFEKAALTLALFANMIAVMLALDMIDSFDIGNPWFRFTLIIFSVFYCQYYSWKIVGAYRGGNWRIIFITLALFTLYQWLKRGEENIKYVFPFVIGAGLFSHNGFLMIGFELVYLTSGYLFYIKKIRSLYDCMTFMIPVMIYCGAWLSKFSKLACLLFSIGILIFYLLRLKRKYYVKLIRLEDFLIDHAWKIYYIGIPVIFLIGTFWLRFFTKSEVVPYSSYVDFFSTKSIGTYLFLTDSWLDIFLDIFRWVGMFVFLVRASEKEDKMMRLIFLGMIVFFVNPLCMGMLSKITGLEMYAHAFEIIFNPFTDVMLFYWIYRQFEWTVFGQWVLELTLIFTAIFGHITSFTNNPSGLYYDLLTRDTVTGEVMLP